MSDLQEIIANTTKKAFNQGIRTEREHIIEKLNTTKQQTTCECEGCQSWKNAFDWLIAEIANER